MSETSITLVTFGVLSLGFLIPGLYYQRFINRLRANGKKAKGLVIKNHFNATSNGGYYQPEVQFTTEEGETITRILRLGTRPKLLEGTEVEVLYDPAKPTRFEINNFFRMVLVPLLLIGLGICMLILMIYLLINP